MTAALFRKNALLRLSSIPAILIILSLACNLPPQGGTLAPTVTPTSAGLPSGWHCYQNTTYLFEVCYPGDATLTTADDAHSRIDLTITPGTNLVEKWMDVAVTTGVTDCGTPQAAGYAPGAVTSSTQTIGDLTFLLQSASEGAAGSTYTWEAYSTQRGTVCVSLTGVLHATDPGNYSTPPPLYDQGAESAVFAAIAASFHWLDVPLDWTCTQNLTYQFEFCYPAGATVQENTPEHMRLNLPFTPGTNLQEKWLDVDARNGAASCTSPSGVGYAPGSIDTNSQIFNGLTFTVESASQGAAGSLYDWYGFSTARDPVCVSLTGTLHSTNPGNYSTPPPLFDQSAESAVFSQVASTFRWLGGPTPTPAPGAPMATFKENTNCLRGPSIDYEVLTYIKKGITLEILGRNPDSTWFYVQPPRSQLFCWVWSGLVQTTGNPNKVPLQEAPLLGCWVYVPGTFTTGKVPGKNVCKVPCPDNAVPGGACMP
jgi:hypothetical protein